jgi:hypothetical protein
MIFKTGTLYKVNKISDKYQIKFNKYEKSKIQNVDVHGRNHYFRLCIQGSVATE